MEIRHYTEPQQTMPEDKGHKKETVECCPQCEKPLTSSKTKVCANCGAPIKR